MRNRKTPTRQKGVRVDARLLDSFEAHCASRMFDERIILECVLLYATRASDEDMQRLRAAREAWFSEQVEAAGDLEAVERAARAAGIGRPASRSRRGAGGKPRQSNG
jgi:hypothetical protein